MWTFIGILLLIWLVVTFFGFIVKGLLWLAVIGIILFVVTAVVGMVKQRANRGT